MQFKNFVPYFFRNGFHHFLEVNNFVLVLIGGEKVNFIIINKRFSQNVHNRVCFSATTLAGVTEVKNEIKDAEQGRDVVMSDVFKTLRDPLIEQQKKTDAKQNAVIDQLKANQLALTGGLKDLVESNRDVLTLQQELPFPRIEEPPKEKPLIAEPNNLFGEDELKFIKDEGLIEPNELLKLEKGKLNFS